MSIQATHQDARDEASTQVSLAEFLQGSACEDLGESDVAQRDDTRDDLDYSQDVFITEHGTHYHAVQYGGICACPNLQGTTVSLQKAVEDGNLPCAVCNPVDYRCERPDKEGSL